VPLGSLYVLVTFVLRLLELKRLAVKQSLVHAGLSADLLPVLLLLLL
jgi:hypothetical protein